MELCDDQKILNKTTFALMTDMHTLDWNDFPTVLKESLESKNNLKKKRKRTLWFM